MNETTQEMIKALKESPLYAMSLGGRELYHSNFWAWLMRKNPYIINVFFKDVIKKVEKTDIAFNITVNGIGEYREIDPMDLIKRENANTDIKIQLGNNVFIIENKIKTLPYREQLLKYQYQSKGFKKGCYTGLVDPHFTEDDIEFECQKKRRNEKFKKSDWSFISYAEISTKIMTTISNTSGNVWFNNFEKDIIKNYCADIANINNIIKEKLSGKTVLKFEFETDPELNSIRMDDVYKKLKADIVSKDICAKISSMRSNNAKFTLQQEIDFSRDKPLLSFKYIYDYNGKVKNVCSIGVQIQNETIRRYIETKKGGIQKVGYDYVFDKFASKKWFDKSYTPETRQIHLVFCNRKEEEYKTNMNPKQDNQKNSKNELTYNTFGDFIYQHYTINNNGLSTIDKLIENIQANLEYANSILNDAEKIFKELMK